MNKAAAARKIQKIFRRRRTSSGPGFTVTQPKIISTVSSLQIVVNFGKIFYEKVTGFTEVAGYVNLRSKPRVRYVNGQWIGEGADQCKYVTAKTKNLTVILTKDGIQVSGAGNFEEAYVKCAKNEWVSKSIIRMKPKYKIINCSFKINKKINLESFAEATRTLIPHDMLEDLPVVGITAPALSVKFKKPKVTYQIFKNGTILFSGITKIDDIGVPVELFKQFFTNYGFGLFGAEIFSGTATTAKNRNHPLAGTWNKLPAVVPRGYYIRPGPNGLPRLYPYEFYRKLQEGPNILNGTVNLGPLAPKVRKAFENAGKPIPASTLKVFRNAGHPLNAVTNKKTYAGISNRRANSWNATKEGYYVRPGPGQQPYWFAVPKGKAAGRKTVISTYTAAGRNIPAAVRALFNIPANVKTAGAKPEHKFEVGANGVLRINGRQATRLTKPELLAVARNAGIAEVSNKTKPAEIIARIKSRKAPSPISSTYNVTIGSTKYKFMKDGRVQKLKSGAQPTTREWATMSREAKDKIIGAVIKTNNRAEFNKFSSADQFGVIYQMTRPKTKTPSPTRSLSSASSSMNSLFADVETTTQYELKQKLKNYYRNGNNVNLKAALNAVKAGPRGKVRKANLSKATKNFVAKTLATRKRNSAVADFESKFKVPAWLPANKANAFKAHMMKIALTPNKETGKYPKRAQIANGMKPWINHHIPQTSRAAYNYENLNTGKVVRVPAWNPPKNFKFNVPKIKRS